MDDNREKQISLELAKKLANLDLNDDVMRDYVNSEGFAAMCSARGIERVATAGGLRIVDHGYVYPGFDNIEARARLLAGALRACQINAPERRDFAAIMARLPLIGGSRAQRDVFQRTLAQVAASAGAPLPLRRIA